MLVFGDKFVDKHRTGPFNRAVESIARQAGVSGSYSKKKDGPWFDFSGLMPEIQFVLIGGFMEITSDMLKEVNKEVEESKKILQRLHDDSKATYTALKPELDKLVQKIRESRMAVTLELKQALSAMRDVRTFFLESDYEKEMERLERFVALGERMKTLIQDGTIDAMCDVVLKLAIGKEPGNEEKSIEGESV